MTENEKLARTQSIMALECRNCQHRWPKDITSNDRR